MEGVNVAGWGNLARKTAVGALKAGIKVVNAGSGVGIKGFQAMGLVIPVLEEGVGLGLENMEGAVGVRGA